MLLNLESVEHLYLWELTKNDELNFYVAHFKTTDFT